MDDRVLAIVVCHNPDIAALKKTVQALCEQVAHIVLVDNASTNVDEIEKFRSQQVNLLAKNVNLGLGAAHNLGIRYAHDHDYNYCLLMDQDSVPQADMVQNLRQALHTKQQQTKVSAVGVRYLNAENGSDSFFVRFGKLKFQRHYCVDQDDDGCIKADFLISSGSLIETDTFQTVGTMDEGLFIDHIDTDWFLRAKYKKYQAFGVCNAVMQHGLGEETHRVKLRRERNVPQHKPFRYYYIFRNSITLYKRHYANGWWIWNDVQRLFQIAVMFGLLKAPRWQNFKMMRRGIVDGLKGVEGQVEFD